MPPIETGHPRHHGCCLTNILFHQCNGLKLRRYGFLRLSNAFYGCEDKLLAIHMIGRVRLLVPGLYTHMDTVYTCCILLCYATSNSFAPHLRTCRWCFNVDMWCFRWCFAQNILGASDETTKHEQMEIACFSSKLCNHFHTEAHRLTYKDLQRSTIFQTKPTSLDTWTVAERLPKTKARPESTMVVESQPTAGWNPLKCHVSHVAVGSVGSAGPLLAWPGRGTERAPRGTACPRGASLHSPAGYSCDSECSPQKTVMAK